MIFSYGFHGPRQHIWDTVWGNLQDLAFCYAPVTLTCDIDEHLARMTRDGRDEGRIQRALDTRGLYDGLAFPRIDTTHLPVEQVAEAVLAIVRAKRVDCGG